MNATRASIYADARLLADAWKRAPGANMGPMVRHLLTRTQEDPAVGLMLLAALLHVQPQLSGVMVDELQTRLRPDME